MLFHTKAVKGEVQWAFLQFSKVREFNFFKFIKSGIAIYAGPQAARLNTCYFHMSMDVGSNEAAYSSRFVPVESFQTQSAFSPDQSCITAEDMEKSQHTDFNEDTTNESASVACSNIRL